MDNEAIGPTSVLRYGVHQCKPTELSVNNSALNKCINAGAVDHQHSASAGKAANPSTTGGGDTCRDVPNWHDSDGEEFVFGTLLTTTPAKSSEMTLIAPDMLPVRLVAPVVAAWKSNGSIGFAFY